MISKNSIENLKNIVDIADVVGSYIPLKKSGANFVCVCPFHNDKHPSMSISPSKGIYHCFSCKAGGDAIKFVMEYEKLGYVEAIEKLASIYNVALEYTSSKNEPKIDKKILENLNLHYKTLLYKNPEALNYLKSRSITDAIIEKWELGWAAGSQNTLNLLQNENIEPKEALEVGAIKQNESGYYASFINRITFPIYNHLGRLVGFGGRTISDNPAKYINSPQSQIFDKSKIFYGYDKAKSEIYRSHSIVICEGYMDCIMLHAAGINNAVAVLGTALTQKHIPLIQRGDIKVTLSFDSDSAGINAAFKSARLLMEHQIDGKVVLISGGKDPAELVASGKDMELRDMLSGGVELGEFYITQLVKNLNPKTPIEIAKSLKAIQEFSFGLNPIVADAYVPLVSTLLRIDPGSFRLSKTTKRRDNSNLAKTQTNTQIQNLPVIEKKDIAELSILKNMLKNPEYCQIVEQYYGVEIFKDKATYRAVVGSQSQNNEYIRELELSQNLEEYKSVNELHNAIRPLAVGYYERLLKNKNLTIEEIIECKKRISMLKGKR
ncbi:DNA primase [Campylobacter vicugnae]|uniref:DNA primase n=1 Tax=Campylobacter vicugnae TaxID=1660076 RepID=UPI000A338E81|nr:MULTISPECIES: DNA primase [Campylobacter]MDL0095347.1 DNA primase [Campylobacter ovis]MDL0105692.1 DNA primase [Campylobacter ovis]MDL0107288.1 DNA primase [Campylobacter ovis]